jgi:hypothetical protein
MCLLAMTQYAPPYALRVMTVIFGTVASAKRTAASRPRDDAAVLLRTPGRIPARPRT